VQQVYLEVRQLGTLLGLLAEQDLGLWSLSEWPPAAAAASAAASGGGPLVTAAAAAAPLSDAEVQATRAHLRLPPATVRAPPPNVPHDQRHDTTRHCPSTNPRSPHYVVAVGGVGGGGWGWVQVGEEAGGREKLLDTLSDLERASLRSPGVLQLFLEDLLDLLDPHAVPSFHFGVLPLLLRFLHHSPRYHPPRLHCPAAARMNSQESRAAAN
jgi:hypothetical protein